MAPESIGSPALWAGFLSLLLVLLALDLGVFHRRAHVVSLREAGIWSGVWVALAALFNLGVYAWFGPERALEFTAGYLIEKALAVDNIFVFVVIFTTFAIPAVYQHRVLFWGILGALIMRAGFILAGGALLHAFHWVMYVFGAVLVLTGIKLLQREREMHPERNPRPALSRG
jgi:tellurite resistance protein TerC